MIVTLGMALLIPLQKYEFIRKYAKKRVTICRNTIFFIIFATKNSEQMITVGIPVYNCEKKLITRCVNSVLSQSEEDIELLIVNDCCTDNTMQYIEETIKHNSYRENIRIINHEKNTGIAGSRNTILEEAQGEYVFFIDCDDYLPSDTIKIMVQVAKEKQAEAVWGSVMEKIYETGEERVHIQYPDLSFVGEDKLAYYANHDSNENIPNSIWNILMDTSFIRQNKLRFESCSYFDDYIFLNKMLPLVKRAAFISDFTYYWVIRTGSQSHPIEAIIPSYNIKQAVVANKILKDLCRSLRDKSYFEGYCLKLHKHCFFTAFTMVKHRKRLDYRFTNVDIKKIITPIVTIKEVIKFNHYKKQNMFFCLLGETPAFMVPFILQLLNKYRRLKNKSK